MSCNCNRIAGLDCCEPENPFGSRRRICCDCDGDLCAEYDEENRDCFWPDFCHPTWLCCRILYGCGDNRVSDIRDDDDNEGSRRRHRRCRN